MYLGKKQQFDWTFCLMVGDFVTLVASFPITIGAIAQAARSGLIPVSWAAPPFLTCVAYGAILLYLLHQFGFYTWRAFTRISSVVLRIGTCIFSGALAFIALGFLFGETFSGGSARWLLVHMVILTLLILIVRVLMRWVLMDLLHVIPIERIAFIGWSPRLERILKAMAAEMGRFHEMIGYFKPTKQPDSQPPASNSCLGNLSDLEKRFNEEKISLLLVEESSLASEELQLVGEVCGRCLVSLKVIPNAFDIWATKLSLRVVAGIPLLGVYDLRYDRFQNRIAKRALDIVCALFGILVSAPIIAIMAVLITMESPGPIFFKQTRLGRYGKPFKIIKLRSMKIDAEKQSGAVWAVKDDPRRLKIGAFMRSKNIDELPQFWNVLKGEMSMVGPRPERPEFVTDFKSSVRYYNLRHSCKPGVTGWAAVHGLRGDTSLDDRLEYDLFYLENWSIWLDIKTMFMTLMPPKNAY